MYHSCRVSKDCGISCNHKNILIPERVLSFVRSYVAVNAKLKPSMAIPKNAKAIQVPLLWLSWRLSANSDKATLVITPEVTANMPPYTPSVGDPILLLLANLNHNAATPAPMGCETPPKKDDHAIALTLDPIARYKGSDMANPSVIL